MIFYHMMQTRDGVASTVAVVAVISVSNKMEPAGTSRNCMEIIHFTTIIATFLDSTPLFFLSILS